MYAYFKNRVGDTCTTNWLFNNARHIKGYDPFDNVALDYFNWNEVGCVRDNGFYVPNKVNA